MKSKNNLKTENKKEVMNAIYNEINFLSWMHLQIYVNPAMFLKRPNFSTAEKK